MSLQPPPHLPRDPRSNPSTPPGRPNPLLDLHPRPTTVVPTRPWIPSTSLELAGEQITAAPDLLRASSPTSSRSNSSQSSETSTTARPSPLPAPRDPSFLFSPVLTPLHQLPLASLYRKPAWTRSRRTSRASPDPASTLFSLEQEPSPSPRHFLQLCPSPLLPCFV